MSRSVFAQTAVILILLSPIHRLQAQTITWSGRQWKLTSGGMAGVAKGDPANVSIDAKGYLHLNIVQRHDKWTASELFTMDNYGFGIYQWVIEGNVYDMDKSTVLGLFPYGPVHHIGSRCGERDRHRVFQVEQYLSRLQCGFHRLPRDRKPQKGWRFRLGRQLPRRGRRADHSKDRMGRGPHHVHSDERGPAHRHQCGSP
jgi:hypothetical protein